MAAVLRLAASDPRVDRIFVNPVIKRSLCEGAAGEEDRAWLRKIRSWWGHDEHFHVRLSCPEDSKDCVPQAPLPDDDGCDVGWWFRPENAGDREQGHRKYEQRVKAAPRLPAACDALLR